VQRRERNLSGCAAMGTHLFDSAMRPGREIALASFSGSSQQQEPTLFVGTVQTGGLWHSAWQPDLKSAPAPMKRMKITAGPCRVIKRRAMKVAMRWCRYPHEILARYEDVLWLRLRENGALQTDRNVAHCDRLSQPPGELMGARKPLELHRRVWRLLAGWIRFSGGARPSKPLSPMQAQPVPGHGGRRWFGAALRHRWTRLPQSTQQPSLIFCGLATFPAHVRGGRGEQATPSRIACCRQQNFREEVRRTQLRCWRRLERARVSHEQQP